MRTSSGPDHTGGQGGVWEPYPSQTQRRRQERRKGGFQGAYQGHTRFHQCGGEGGVEGKGSRQSKCM